MLIRARLAELVYDVTSRTSFDNLDTWFNELDTYTPSKDVVKIIIGNKIDEEAKRQVTREEGIALARRYNTLFIECSAKTKTGIQQAFEELVHKILETPSLVSSSAKKRETVASTTGSSVNLSAPDEAKQQGPTCLC